MFVPGRSPSSLAKGGAVVDGRYYCNQAPLACSVYHELPFLSYNVTEFSASSEAHILMPVIKIERVQLSTARATSLSYIDNRIKLSKHISDPLHRFDREIMLRKPLIAVLIDLRQASKAVEEIQLFVSFAL